MGIRFYCPKGHKLNVKEFQAGRRGICPFCGARTQIPMQSTRPSSKGRRRAGASAHHAGHDEDDEQSSDSSPDILPGEPPGLPGDPASKILGPSTGLQRPSAGPVAAPPTMAANNIAANSGLGRNAASSPPSTAAQPRPGGTVHAAASAVRPPATAQPSAPFPSVADVLATPTSAAPTSAAPTNAAPSPLYVNHREAAAPPVPPRAAPAEPPDPIAEAPEMIWYIRPPSGGQFGPAPGELMRTWIGEGRVSADSLVWREGWRDWQEAGTVFPKLLGTQLMDVLESLPSVPAAAAGRPQGGSSAHAHRPKSGASSDRSQIAPVAVLVVLVVVLLLVLIYFVTRP